MTTLFELSTDIEQLEIALSEIDEGEEQAELMLKYLETSGSLKSKLDNYCTLITELEGRAEIRKQEAKRLQERATVDANLAKRLKAMLLWYMQTHGLKKTETLRYSINVAKAGGKLPLIVNENYLATELPERFQKKSIELDKDEARLALENGEELPFARLGTRQEIIKIK